MLAVVHRLGDECYYTVDTPKALTEKILTMLRKNEKIKNIVFAHQAQYDCAFLDFDEIGKTFELLSSNMTPFFLTYRKRKKEKRSHSRQNLLFLDSMNFLKTSVRQLGEMFDCPKLDIDFEKATFEEMEIYCKRDVEILAKTVNWIIEFHKQYDVPMSLTFPQFTYRLYRKRYLPTTLKQTTNELSMTLERLSYMGGRTEVFDFNRYSFAYVYDFNSLYPSIMNNNIFPVSVVREIMPSCARGFSFIELFDEISIAHENNQGVIAEVTLDLPKSKIGIVPVRYNDKLCFPNGQFTTALCSPELKMIQEYITEIKQLVVYEMKDIFSEYIYYCYEERQKAKDENDEIMNWFWKLLMNSLYGKFGQRRYRDIPRPEYDNLYDFATSGLHENGQLKNLTWLGGQAIEKKTSALNLNSFVAISSFVTSYARAKLYRYLSKYPDTIYCDTDSLFLPNQEIESSDFLGGLKLEKIYYDFQAHGNKWYNWGKEKRFDGKKPSKIKRKVKGVTHDAKLISDNEKESVYEMAHITKFKESIKRYGKPIPVNTIIIKHLSKSYDKRIKLKDGTTKPLCLSF